MELLVNRLLDINNHTRRVSSLEKDIKNTWHEEEEEE